MCNLIYSNSLKILSNHFISALSRSMQLHKELIITPNESIKQYLMQKITLLDGICFGLQWSSLESSLELLWDLSPFPSKERLYFAMLSKLLEKEGVDHRIRKAFRLAETFQALMHYPHNPSEEEALWKEIFAENKWSDPFEIDLTGRSIPYERVHLFGFSFLPPSYMRFFESLLDKGYFYLFSPCSYYWEDLLSQKERAKSKRYFQKKKLSSYSIEKWEEWVSRGNPFLASMGRLGREMLLSFSKDHQETEEYQKPKSSFLGEIQKDLLEGTLPEKKDVTPDNSFVWVASSNARYKEVERLSLLLTEAFAGDPTLRFSDIQVYAPHIESYRSSIEWAFPFPYTIYDAQGHSSLFQALLHFVQNPEKIENLFLLLAERAFLSKHIIQLSDLKRWEEIFQRLHIKRGIGVTSFPFSVDKGLERWIKALSFLDEESLDLDMTESKSIDILLLTLSTLSKVQELFSGSNYYTMKEWRENFHNALKELFDFSVDSISSSLYLQYEHSLSSMESECSEVKFPGDAFAYLLKKKIGSFYQDTKAQDLNMISFRSIRDTPMPGKIIALLGMDEESFPRKDSLYIEKGSSYFPTQVDRDRYFFMQAIFAAEEKFWLFHREESEEDAKKISISPICQEFFSYLESIYTLGKESPVTMTGQRFPLSLYDPSLFTKKYKGPSPSFIHYEASSSLQEKKDLTQALLPPNWGELDEMKITLIDLMQGVKSPIQLYLQNSSIFVDRKSEEGEFSISPITKKKYLTQALSVGRESEERWIESGEMPGGIFQSLALQNLHREYLLYKEHFQEWGIDPERLSVFSFSETLEEKIEIYGELEMIHANGLIVYGKNGFESAIRGWPSFLVRSYLFPDYEPFFLFVKDGEKKEIPPFSAKEMLSRYFYYYKACKDSLFPFTTSSLSSFLKGKEFEMDKVAEFDSYAKWFFTVKDVAIEDENSWREKLRWVFTPLLEAYGL